VRLGFFRIWRFGFPFGSGARNRVCGRIAEGEQQAGKAIFIADK